MVFTAYRGAKVYNYFHNSPYLVQIWGSFLNIAQYLNRQQVQSPNQVELVIISDVRKVFFEIQLILSKKYVIICMLSSNIFPKQT